MKIDWQSKKTKIIAAVGCLVLPVWMFNFLLFTRSTQTLIVVIPTILLFGFIIERIGTAAYRRLKSDPSAQRKFAFWAVLLGLYILTLHQPDSNFTIVVWLTGFLSNLFFAICLRPWMMRPFIKVFSEETHRKITEIMITFQAWFIIIFTRSVVPWRLYMLHEHPDFVAFLHKIFG